MTSAGSGGRGALAQVGSVEALFRPRALAVLGASRDRNKWGRRVIDYSVRAGFKGQIFAVNPAVSSGTSSDDVNFVRSLSDVSEEVDLAVIALPARLTPEAVEECANSRVKAVVLAASGFGELGGNGQLAERQMRDIAAGAGMRLLGPNGFGLFVGESGLNLTPREDIPRGSVGLLTQSGNIAIALFREASKAGIGFSSCLGVGNQIDVGFGDLLTFLATDYSSAAVAVYVEGLPAGAGGAFAAGLAACRQAGKPVVVLKGGSTLGGAKAAASHTGSLAADDRVWDAVLQKEGAIRVGSTQEMVDVLSVARMRLAGGRVMVLTDGGGDSVMAADALSRGGLRLARPEATTVARLDGLVPPEAPRTPERNPVTLDTAGGLQDDPMLLARCASVVADDPGVDLVLVGGIFGGYPEVRDEELECVNELLRLRSNGLAIAVQSAFAEPDEAPLAKLREAGVPTFPTVQRLVRALELNVRPQSLAEGVRGPATESTTAGTIIDIDEAARLLQKYRVQVPPYTRIENADQLVRAADNATYPACLKLADPAIAHKSDVGGVVLNIADSGELISAGRSLRDRFPNSDLIVMPMLAAGTELLIGTTTDPVFGTITVIGRGGIWAEVDPDVVVLVGQQSTSAVVQSLLRLRSAATLTGGRGQARADLASVANLVCALGDLNSEHPEITIDLNPVFAYADSCAIADFRVLRVGHSHQRADE